MLYNIILISSTADQYALYAMLLHIMQHSSRHACAYTLTKHTLRSIINNQREEEERAREVFYACDSIISWRVVGACELRNATHKHKNPEPRATNAESRTHASRCCAFVRNGGQLLLFIRHNGRATSLSIMIPRKNVHRNRIYMWNMLLLPPRCLRSILCCVLFAFVLVAGLFNRARLQGYALIT